jgi:hypothetical protein
MRWLGLDYFCNLVVMSLHYDLLIVKGKRTYVQPSNEYSGAEYNYREYLAEEKLTKTLTSLWRRVLFPQHRRPDSAIA